MKRWLCIWLPNWPIQRRYAPQISDAGEALDPNDPRPLVVWHDDPRRGRRVIAHCRRAGAAGIRLQMPVTEAVALAQTQANPPQLVPHDASLDRQHLLALAEAIHRQITPVVSLEQLDEHRWAGRQRCEAEAIFCEISGAAHLFGGEAGLAKAAERLLRGRKLYPSMAIADTPGAAWGLAHYAPPPPRGSGPPIAPAGASGVALKPLPVEALRISPATLGTLRRLGVERVDQLLQLPRSGLASRLGESLVERIDQVSGQRNELLPAYHPPADDTDSWQLEYPSDDHRILRDRLDRLAERVAARLAARDRGALSLECRWDLTDHPPVSATVGLFAPTTDAKHWTDLIAGAMEIKSWRSPVIRITLAVRLSGRLRSTQTSLFATAPNGWQLGPAIARLVDTLSGRLGRDAVQGVRLIADPLPENAYRCFPWTARPAEDLFKAGRNRKRRGRSRRGRAGDEPPVPDHDHFSRWNTSPCDALRRPLELLPEPQPLQVVGPGPSAANSGESRRVLRTRTRLCHKAEKDGREATPLSPLSPAAQRIAGERDRVRGDFVTEPSGGGVPGAFRLSGTIHRVIRHWGPERIETAWWRGPSIRRDYYRVELDSGDWWWIFRDLANDADNSRQQPAAWMLHGRFR